MNTLEQSSIDKTPSSEDPFVPPKISGFEGTTRSVFKDPSLYLSLAIVTIATYACLGKSPTVFWVSLISLLLVALAFHVVAEKVLFRSKKEFEFFTAPFEGIFVVTFGAILPGLGLLAYGAYALTSAQPTNPFETIGKLALLLVVPLFNFCVWSAVRKGYLIRPRIVGLMNGFALGLSTCWTAVWIKSAFFPGNDLSCKFGWMLLLCASPFMLFASVCLSRDLCIKTESNINRITTTFAVLGILLSFLFVMSPMVRSLYVQTVLSDARYGSLINQPKSVTHLRSIATDEDLRPAKFPVSGFSLAELLIPNRGLDTGTDTDRDLYFKITGKPFDEKDAKSASEADTKSPTVGEKIAGLSLAKSHFTGSIDSSSLSSSIDWALTFHNSSLATQEARCEIGIPKGGVVSRVTLWINGVSHDGAFASTSKAQQAYDSVVSKQRDPLLVTMSAPDRVLVQCFPVPAKGGGMKIRLGLKVPLDTTDGTTGTVELPRLLDSNFTKPKRHLVDIVSNQAPVKTLPGIESKISNGATNLSGFIKTDEENKTTELTFKRASSLPVVAVADAFAQTPRYILQKLNEAATEPLKQVFVVIDTSSSIRQNADDIKKCLSLIPVAFKPAVYIVREKTEEESEVKFVPESIDQAKKLLASDLFVGGKDNWPALQNALETAAEKKNCAVLWIHGPQPLSQNLAEASALDLVNKVALYDMQIGKGLNSISQRLPLVDPSSLLSTKSIEYDSHYDNFKAMLRDWEKGCKTFIVKRESCSAPPKSGMLKDAAIAAQITSLWAKGQLDAMLRNGQQQKAEIFAGRYRIVSPVTAAVVLESDADYVAFDLKRGDYKNAEGGGVPISVLPAASTPSIDPLSRLPKAPTLFWSQPAPRYSGAGLVGAPVDPRYGQSNEVGQLQDFGYDTARDTVRTLTGIAALISIIVAACFLKKRKTMPKAAIAKALIFVLAVPTIVHFFGTFIINNFGGLGGGI